MSSELEQAKFAFKALAEAGQAGKRIDLSGVPEPLRRKIQAQLEKMPPQMREQLLARSGTLIDAATTHSAPLQRPGPVLPGNYSGHYNNTVQAGDRIELSVGKLLLIVAVSAAAYYFWF